MAKKPVLIYIVEDSVPSAMLYKSYVETLGYQARVFYTGDENGYLQAEIDHGTSHFEVSKGNFHCEANFSNPESSDLIVQLGTLQCL